MSARVEPADPGPDEAEHLAMAENPHTVVSPEVFDELLASLDEPSEPSPALVRAAHRILDSKTVADFLSTGRVDWFTTAKGKRLHWAQITSEHHGDIIDGWYVEGPVLLACGNTGTSLQIPGLGDRLSATRCAGCCRATGLPRGDGSPKNDDECRRILGLKASA